MELHNWSIATMNCKLLVQGGDRHVEALEGTDEDDAIGTGGTGQSAGNGAAARVDGLDETVERGRDLRAECDNGGKEDADKERAMEQL